MGALAQSLRVNTSWAVVLLWWTILVLLVVACVHPNLVALSAVWLYAVVLACVRSARRNLFRRNLAELPCLSRAAPVDPRHDWPKVTVFVPARNEENSLDEAARSLATLPYPGLDVWFINDHSTDRTPAILDALKHDYPKVHVLHDPPVVDGWFGKSNALWQAVLQIDREHDTTTTEPEQGPQYCVEPPVPNRDRGWLLFADADVEFEPGILQQAVALAERDNLDFLTCIPRLVTKTWAEQLLLPNGWRGIVQGADYKSLNDPHSYPIGIGAFMLVKYTSYKACGGHRALGQWHPEDALLAAAVKHIGGRVGFAWTPDLLRVRFYHGYREVKIHTLRKMRILFGDRLHLPLTMLALRLSTTLIALPIMAAGILPQLITGRFDVVLTLFAGAGIVLYIDEAREFAGVEHIADFHPLAPWLHPVSGLLRVWFALSIIWQIVTKKPMDWRGRSQFGTTGPAPIPPDA